MIVKHPKLIFDAMLMKLVTNSLKLSGINNTWLKVAITNPTYPHQNFP